MGTRSLTFVNDGDVRLLCMYRQFDDYPSGHGTELAEFLLPLRIVNGLSGDNSNVANGPGCLAAQLVAHFKGGPGGIYIYPPETDDAGQDYEYHVKVYRAQGFGELGAIEVQVRNSRGEVLYGGEVLGFAEFCNRDD